MERKNSIVVTEFSGNALSFSSFNLILNTGLAENRLYYVWVYLLYPCSLHDFYHEEVLDFVKRFFPYLMRLPCVFSLCLFIWTDLHMLNHPYITEIKPT